MDLQWLLLGLLKIMLINIVLSGDNAVVIALACRNLPEEQQKKAIFLGSLGAIALRIVLTFAAVWLLHIPFVQLAGGLLLVWIALKLMKGEDEEGELTTSSELGVAIKTILIADLVMSLDNVLAVAGAADGNYALIGLALAISIPLIIWGSTLIMRLMKKFPIIIVLGVALLGYTAGEMIIGDERVAHALDTLPPIVHSLLPVLLAVAIVTAGKLMQRKQHTVIRQDVQS